MKKPTDAEESSEHFHCSDAVGATVLWLEEGTKNVCSLGTLEEIFAMLKNKARGYRKRGWMSEEYLYMK